MKRFAPFTFLIILLASLAIAATYQFDIVKTNTIYTKGPYADCEMFANISTAKVYAQANGLTLRVTTAQTPRAALTFNCPVEFTYPGSISVVYGVTFLKQPIINGLYQVFTGTGTVTGLKEARPEWFGTDGTATNDTLAWQAAVNSAPRIYADGAYVINATRVTPMSGAKAGIVVPSDRQIILAEHATLTATPNSSANYAIFGAYDVENVSITGGTLIGERAGHTPSGGPSDEYGFGVDYRGVTNGKVTNVIIKDFQGDGIYLGAGSVGTFCDGIIIEKNTLDNNYRQGLSIVGANNVKVLHNIIRNTNGTTPQAGIDIETNNAAVAQTDILIDGNRFETNVGGAIDILRGQKVRIVNNYFSDYGGVLFAGSAGGAATSDVTVENNNFYNMLGTAFQFQDNLDAITIVNNTIRAASIYELFLVNVAPTTEGHITVSNNHIFAQHSNGHAPFAWGVIDTYYDWDIERNDIYIGNGTQGVLWKGNHLNVRDNNVTVTNGGLSTAYVMYFAAAGRIRIDNNRWINQTTSGYKLQSNKDNIILGVGNSFDQYVYPDSINVGVPASGYWTIGTFIPKWNSTITTQSIGGTTVYQIITGYYRITNGTGNTLGTGGDWVEMRSLVGGP